jgi:AraC-like DNA-binding protein
LARCARQYRAALESQRSGERSGHVAHTSFAERFKSLVGMAPLEYLTRWRVTIARHALRREDANLATIAEAIG